MKSSSTDTGTAGQTLTMKDSILMQSSQQRMGELATLAKASKFNQVYPLQKVDYSRDVTEASREAFIFVNMTSSSGTNMESRLVTDLWRQLAPKFGDIKFCEIRADLCVEGYPEKNTPTILIYKDGDIKKQLITLKELNGSRTSFDGIKKQLFSTNLMLIWRQICSESSSK